SAKAGEVGEPTTREVRTRDAEWLSNGFAPAHRHHLGACRKRVQPLRGCREPGPDDRYRSRVVVRLVGVDDPRIGAELVRHPQAWMARSEQNASEPLAVDLEAAVDGPHLLD